MAKKSTGQLGKTGKIGVLITQNEIWNNKQVVSIEWIKENLQPYSKSDEYYDLYRSYEAFVCSWWLENDTITIWANGYKSNSYVSIRSTILCLSNEILLEIHNCLPDYSSWMRIETTTHKAM